MKIGEHVDSMVSNAHRVDTSYQICHTCGFISGKLAFSITVAMAIKGKIERSLQDVRDFDRNA